MRVPQAGLCLCFAPTLKGVVVGLDALADGLFQVSLLHTLDPQVLEAMVSQASVCCLRQSPFLLSPSPGPGLGFAPSISFPLRCDETHSLPLASLCGTQPIKSPGQGPPPATGASFPTPKHTILIPSSRSLHFFLVHGMFFSARLVFLTT